jgi:hypothetical protein
MCNGGTNEEVRYAFESRDHVPYTFETTSRDGWTVTGFSINLNPFACIGYVLRHDSSLGFKSFSACASNVYDAFLKELRDGFTKKIG